ncbi:MAG: hypothetical protein ACC652_13830, partial [Acidimicrobiales bacterium]
MPHTANKGRATTIILASFVFFELLMVVALRTLGWFGTGNGIYLTVCLLVTVLPLLFLLIGYSFQGVGPDGVDGMITQLVRIVVGGVVVALFFTAISMAASSMAEKRLYASVGLVLALVGVPITAGILTEQADVSRNLHLLNLFTLPLELVFRVYGDPGDLPEVSTVSLAAAWLAWIVVGFGFTFWRYQRLAVTR